MIIIGKILDVLGECDDESLKKALSKIISAKHADMLDVNLKTIKLGAEL